MTENIGLRDRLARTVVAVLAGLAAVAWAADLRLSAPAAVVAVWLAGTVITRRCPLYCIMGLSTLLSTRNRSHAPSGRS